MIILDKFISYSFAKLCVATTLLTTFMMMIIDLFINFQMYSDLKGGQILTLVLLHFPNSLSLVVGPAFLFATTYFISSLYSNNEFISLLSAGISYKRIITPIVVVAILFTGLLFLFNENIKIPADIQYDKKKYEFTDISESRTKDNRNVSISDRKNNITVRAQRYIDNQKKLEKVNIATFTDDNILNEKIVADSAVYNEFSKVWELNKVIIHKFDIDAKEHSVKRVGDYILDKFTIEPMYFRAEGEDVRTMNIFRAIGYLRTIKYISSTMYEQKATDFYKRLFTPFTALIMILVSLSSNLKNKKNALMFSIISSLALGVAYYALDMGFSLMAKQGLIKPLVAVTSPIIGIIVVAFVGASKVSS